MRKNLQTPFSTRQYMLSKDFEIYYYNDTEIRHVENHSHDYYEFHFFLKGDVSLTVGKETIKLEPGDVTLVPPHSEHSLNIGADMPYQRFVFWVSQEFCIHLMQQSPDYGYIFQRTATTHRYVYHPDIFSFNEFRTKILTLIEELNSNRFGKAAKISLDVNDLILSLNRSIYEQDNPETEKESRYLYRNLLSYINDHIHESLTLDDLSGNFYVSKYHIAHVFKEQMNMSVHSYILKKRLDLCRASISAGVEITTAYREWGFNDYTSFYRAFKKEYGLSPKEYKQSQE